MSRLVALEFAQFPVSPDGSVFYSLASKACGKFPANAAGMLRVCASLSTFDEHVTRCMKELRIHPAQRESVQEQLRLLVAAGFFVEEQDLVVRLATAASEGPPAARIETLAFLTCGRQELLDRAVTSFCANAAEFGRTPRVVVMCDGDEDDFRAVEVTLAKARAAFGVETWAIGTTARRALVRALATRGLPEEVLRFGLERDDPQVYAPGAARNALLASTWGSPVICLDDDVVCRTTTFETAKEPALAETSDPTQFRFFRDRAAALAHRQLVPRDFLAEYERFLGRSLSCEPTASIEPMPPSLFRKAARGRPTILTCTAGIVGHSGMGMPHYVYAREGVTRYRLWADAAEYRALVLSREVARFVERPTIAPVGMTMALALGLDAREILPPFAPRYRNQDGLFAATLRACRPDGFAAFLPLAIVHDPSDDRVLPSVDDMWKRAASVRTNDAIIAILETFTPQFLGVDPSAALSSMGAQLVATASRSDASFVEVLRRATLNLRAPAVKNLRRIAALSASAPPLFRQDLDALTKTLERALVEGSGIPDDGKGTIEEQARRTKEYATMHGKLLQIWPDVLSETRALIASGSFGQQT